MLTQKKINRQTDIANSFGRALPSQNIKNKTFNMCTGATCENEQI